MIQIGDILVSTDVVTEYFACDYEKCHGACCVVGDSGTTVLQRIPVRSNTLRNGGRNFLVNGRSAGALKNRASKIKIYSK